MRIRATSTPRPIPTRPRGAGHETELGGQAHVRQLQRTAGNRAVLRLLGKDARGGVMRQPKTVDAPKPPELAAADLVRELTRDNETWTLTMNGDFMPDQLGALLWPGRGVPKDVKVTLKGAVSDPFEWSRFELEGLTPYHLHTMEPSMAKLFAAHGLEEEGEESEELRSARHAFHRRHIDHSTQVLVNIDRALKRITKRNPDLLLAYYKHYAHHKLADQSSAFDGIDFDPRKNAGATSGGDTVINPKVLDLSSNFKTDDPLSLLAGTLIHEFVHTPQGGGSDAVSGSPMEAKAYGVELFFAERMGDRARADRILNMNWSTDSVSRSTGSDKVFSESYDVMAALYRLIDNGGAAADQARRMSVEFIAKNSEDFSPALKQFIAKLRRG